MEKKKAGKTGTKQERIIYQDGIPKQVIEMLDEEIYTQYHIWDEMIKRLVQLHPTLIMPIIEEKFGKTYEGNVKIEFLTTEYSLESVKENGKKTFRVIYADIVLKIEQKDIYHLECQLSPNKEMKIRMYEYDSQIAVLHRKRIWEQEEDEALILPYSVIIYLTHTKNTPDEEKLRVKLPSGDVWEYVIPVLKVQEYSLEQIRVRKLYFLIPLATLRYYSKTTGKKRKNTPVSLTQFLEQCIMIIKEGVRKNYLTEQVGIDIMDSLGQGCYYLFWKEGETLEEIQRVIGPGFRFEREIWEEEMKEEAIEKLIRSLKDFGGSRENVKKQLMKEYELTEMEAESKMELYFK